MKCENCGHDGYDARKDGPVCPECGYCDVCGADDVFTDGHYEECSQ